MLLLSLWDTAAAAAGDCPRNGRLWTSVGDTIGDDRLLFTDVDACSIIFSRERERARGKNKSKSSEAR